MSPLAVKRQRAFNGRIKQTIKSHRDHEASLSIQPKQATQNILQQNARLSVDAHTGAHSVHFRLDWTMKMQFALQITIKVPGTIRRCFHVFLSALWKPLKPAKRKPAVL